METIPHIQIFRFLERLEQDSKTEDITEIKPPRSTDIFAVQNDKFHLYYGTNEDIKKFLQNKGYVGNDGKISIEGRIFLSHYSSWWGRKELYIKDYPLFISSMFSLLAIVISIIALIISFYK